MRPQLTDKELRNKAAATLFFTDVFNKGNLDIVDKGLSPAYLYNGQPQSKQQVKAWVTGLRSNYPDLQFSIQAILTEDDMVALRWHMTGTASGGPNCGKRVEATGTNILTYDKQGLGISNIQNGVCTLPGQPPLTDDLLYHGLYFKSGT